MKALIETATEYIAAMPFAVRLEIVACLIMALTILGMALGLLAFNSRYDPDRELRREHSKWMEPNK